MTYRRRFDPLGDDSLAKLARWVPPGATVLELGAAAGYLTQHLAALGCAVDIIEIDRDAAAEASRFARRTVVADLDGATCVGELGEARYERIICAAVLEHLRHGDALLRQLRPLLAEGGELLLSVPNVAHSALIAQLIDERFDYGGEGLLDATHVHLYTWRSLAQALGDAGWRVQAWDATTLSLYGTEFRVSEQALDPALREALLQRPHALVYQWLARAIPGAGDAPEAPGPTPTAVNIPVRLLQADAEERLTLEHAVAQPLPLGGASVALEWALAAGTRALRLLLADRPAVIEVRALALCAGDEVLWSLDGDPARLRIGENAVPIDARRFALAGDGGWIAPDVSAATIARADCLRATLAWPARVAEPGEHLAFDALAAALSRRGDAARARHDELVAMIEARDAQLAVMYAEEAKLKARLADGEQAAAAGRDDNERLERALQAQERIIDYRQGMRWWFKLPFIRARLAWRKARGAP